jgi:hypothetical protein
LKKIIPIFLLVTICLSHLNIIDAVVHFSARYKAANQQKGKEMPAEKETEKEAKEKAGEDEKLLHRNCLAAVTRFNMSNREKLICYRTILQKHPYREDDTEPPKALL